MKIYHLIENFDDSYGGPAKVIPLLVRDLNKLAVKGQILSVILKKNEVNELVKEFNLDWKRFSNTFLKYSKYSRSLKEYLVNKIKFEKNIIIHTHNLWNYVPFLAYILSKKYQIPLISSLRGSIELNSLKKKISWKLYQKNIFKNSKVIHVTNREDVSKIKKLGITTPIALIPDGVDFDQLKSIHNKNISKKKLGLSKSKKYILFLSRIHKGKGLKYLVNAWIKIANNFSDWDLLIIGPIYDKKYYDNIIDNIKAFKLRSRVHFKGMLRGSIKNDCYKASDLFALPSYSENFGIVIAEAMAAKLPVITTQGTPWKDIKKYDAGWWVKLNQKEINNSLQTALKCKKTELQKKGINGYKLIQKYESKYQSAKMKKVYDWVLGNTRKPKFIY